MAARVLSRRLWGAGVLLGALLCALALGAPRADAATIRVNSTEDFLNNDATCGLREAVLAANNDSAVLGCASGNGDDTILLPPGEYETLIPPNGTENDPLRGSYDVNDPQGSSLEITPAFGRAVIRGGSLDRVFTASSTLILSRLNVFSGDAGQAAEADGLGGGVAALEGAPLLIRASTIGSNDASLAGGGIYATGPLLVTHSTISGNLVDSALAGSGGGGIEALGFTSVTSSTIAANIVQSDDDLGRGGGIRYAAQLTLNGSILADNTAEGGSPECHAEGGSADGSSTGSNVIESPAGCGFSPGSQDATGDPGLAILDDYGGPTLTHAIQPSSVAADLWPSASAAGCGGTNDQRGAPRGETGPCDSGSYEIYPCGPIPANVIGTAGRDTLTSNELVVSALGVTGNDTIVGNNGADALCGGPGIDMLDGRGGGDFLSGGPDVDIASYAAATTPVTVVLDGAANDGRSGEGDLVQTESVIGGTASDSITGDGLANGVQGRAGDDTLRGADGNDSLLGQDGNDTIGGGDGDDELRGGDGNDTVAGDDGDDRLDGEDGNDRLDGGTGRDRLFGSGGKNVLVGGTGNDVLTGGPGKDLFKCGKGRDTVFAQKKKDKVKRDCEKVIRKKR